MKSRLIFLAAIAATLTVPTMAQAEVYSTLADRRDAEGGWVVGYALGYPTADESIREALAECGKHGLGRCTPYFTHPGPVCVAIAEGDDRAAWGGGGGVTRADARAGALRKCGEHSDNCRITANDCTGDGPVAASDLVESDNGGKNDTDGDLWSLDDTQSKEEETTTADNELWKLPTNKQPTKTDDLWTAPTDEQHDNTDDIWQSDTDKLRDDLAVWKRQEEVRKAEERRQREEAARIARAKAEAARIAQAKAEAERAARAEAEAARVALAKAEAERRERKRQAEYARQLAEEKEEEERRRAQKGSFWKGLMEGLGQAYGVGSGSSAGSGYGGSSGGSSGGSTAGISSGCRAAQERAARKIRAYDESISNNTDGRFSVCASGRFAVEAGRTMESVIPACLGDVSAAGIRAQREKARELIKWGKEVQREVCSP